MQKKNLGIIGALALTAAGVATLTAALSFASPGTATVSSKTTAPAWELKDVDGKTVKLEDFKGKVVILDFWATWCGPCRMEIPGFIQLQKQYDKQGLAVIGVSLDEAEPQAVKAFMKKLGMNYSVVMGESQIAREYGGIEAIPTTFVIDRQGMIVAKHIGYADKEQFEKEIKPLLKP